MDMSQFKDETQIYQLDKLMEETRSLAAKYRSATGQTLPMSHDLACYDAIRILGLRPPAEIEAAIDAISDVDGELKKYTIKGRVQFSQNKGKQARVGQINMDADWHYCLLVLMGDDYEPTAILKAKKEVIDDIMTDKPANKRGAMSVAQFHKIAEVVWQDDSENSGSED